MSDRTMTIKAARSGLAEQPRIKRKDPVSLFQRLLKLLSGWYQRSRQRSALKELDDRLLRDIGVTRADVAREVSKSFWQI